MQIANVSTYTDSQEHRLRAGSSEMSQRDRVLRALSYGTLNCPSPSPGVALDGTRRSSASATRILANWEAQITHHLLAARTGVSDGVSRVY